MKRFVVLNFLPGSAGNFVSRCLNLLTGFHVWKPRNSPMPTGINEKLDQLKYKNVLHFPNQDRKYRLNWTRWEHYFAECCNASGHTVADGEVGVIVNHPSNNDVARYLGKNDKLFVFCIDSTDMWDWMIVSAEIKDSFQAVNWFKENKRMLEDPDISKINLKNIVSGQETFVAEFKKICNIINHNLSEEELDAVVILYNQWKTTTPSDEIVQSKKAEMLVMVDCWYNELIDNLNGPR
jgi:hypothetical protein